jgi:hypothetical protein
MGQYALRGGLWVSRREARVWMQRKEVEDEGAKVGRAGDRSGADCAAGVWMRGRAGDAGAGRHGGGEGSDGNSGAADTQPYSADGTAAHCVAHSGTTGVGVALGTVEYDGNGQPAGYEVSAEGGKVLHSAYTDADGAFAIEAPAGVYVLVSPGGSTNDQIMRDVSGTVLIVEVEAGQTVDLGTIGMTGPAGAPLAGGGTITGVFVDKAGEYPWSAMARQMRKRGIVVLKV